MQAWLTAVSPVPAVDLSGVLGYFGRALVATDPCPVHLPYQRSGTPETLEPALGTQATPPGILEYFDSGPAPKFPCPSRSMWGMWRDSMEFFAPHALRGDPTQSWDHLSCSVGVLSRARSR